MNKGFLTFAIVFSLSIIGLGIFGMFNSKNLNKDVKEPMDQENKPVVEQVDVNKLYNYILGFGYYYDYVSDGQFTPSAYYSEVHQQSMVTPESLTDESFIRNAIKQVAVCGSGYELSMPYDVVNNKMNEITERVVSLDMLNISVYMGVESGNYSCMNGNCTISNYCTSTPLNSDYTMVSHSIENDNVVIIDQDLNSNQYKHTFTKNINGNYYWVSSEPMMQ